MENIYQCPCFALQPLRLMRQPCLRQLRQKLKYPALRVRAAPTLPQGAGRQKVGVWLSAGQAGSGREPRRSKATKAARERPLDRAKKANRDKPNSKPASTASKSPSSGTTWAPQAQDMKDVAKGQPVLRETPEPRAVAALGLLTLLSCRPMQVNKYMGLTRKSGERFGVSVTVFVQLNPGGESMAKATKVQVQAAGYRRGLPEHKQRRGVVAVREPVDSYSQVEGLAYISAATKLRDLIKEISPQYLQAVDRMIGCGSHQLEQVYPEFRSDVYDKLAELASRSASPEEAGRCSAAMPCDERSQIHDSASRRGERDEPALGKGADAAPRSPLPIEHFREELLQQLRDHQVVVVEGGMGCGKTTRAPQFILEDAEQRGAGARCRVLVALPRRLPVLAAARRVAHERGEAHLCPGPGGGSVGYAVQLETCRARARASIEFCTAGLVVARLGRSAGLAGVSHVLVDEVHERAPATDLLLQHLRHLVLSGQRRDLRVVVMSATMDADRFLRYFRTAALLRLPALTRFPVAEHFLADLPAALACQQSPGREQRALDAQLRALHRTWQRHLANPSPSEQPRAIQGSGEADLDEQLCDVTAAVVQMLVASHLNCLPGGAWAAPHGPAILCFLPGWQEIARVSAQLRAWHGRVGRRPGAGWALRIHELHSSLPPRHHARAWDPAPPATAKVLLATDIAEASLTFSDVAVVVDSGRVRCMVWDPGTRVSVLETVPISEASAQQRLGRTGRVQAGVCFRLFPRTSGGVPAQRTVPEMQRCSAAALVLQANLIRPELSVRTVLDGVLDPPPIVNIEAAIQELKDLHALTDSHLALRGPPEGRGMTVDGGEKETTVGPSEDSAGQAHPRAAQPSVNSEANVSHEQITALGKTLGILPLDPAVGRMLLMGVLLGCADAALTIAACLATPRARILLDGVHKRGTAPEAASPPEGRAADRDQTRAGARQTAPLPPWVVPESDVLSMVEAYEQWGRGRGTQGARQLGPHQQDVLRQIQHTRRGLEARLRQLGLLRGATRAGAPSRAARARTGGRPATARRQAARSRAVHSALVCAALPALAHQKCGSPALVAGGASTAHIHRTSLNHGLVAASSAGTWLVYQAMLLPAGGTEPQVAITSVATPLQVLMFGGQHLGLHTSARSSGLPSFALLDRWVLCRAATPQHRAALAAACAVRRRLDAGLELLCRSPRSPLPLPLQRFTHDVVELLDADSAPRDAENNVT